MLERHARDHVAIVRELLPDHPDEALPREEILQRTGLSVGKVREALNRLVQTHQIAAVQHGPRSYKYYRINKDAAVVVPATRPFWATAKPLTGYDKQLNDFRDLCLGGR